MNSNYIFFGTGPIARTVLEILVARELAPSAIVTSPDAPKGRGRVLTPSLVAEWASVNIPNLEIAKPAKLDSAFTDWLQATSVRLQANLCIVVDYGKILPASLLEIPAKGFLNMHPSLLPRLRGPSPIRSAILNDEKKVGVTVMLVDEKMDHGPIVTQEEVVVPEWPIAGTHLDSLLARAGGELLAKTISLWLHDTLSPQPQEHEKATFSHFFHKEDGLLNLEDEGYLNYLKYCAFEEWPGTYAFFGSKRVRARIIAASFHEGKFILETVRPEGKNDMPYTVFSKTLD